MFEGHFHELKDDAVAPGHAGVPENQRLHSTSPIGNHKNETKYISVFSIVHTQHTFQHERLHKDILCRRHKKKRQHDQLE